MDIEGLIAAARRIDALAAKHEARAHAWQQLARDAKRGLDRKEIEGRTSALECQVIDYGTAIDALRAALRGTSKSNKPAPHP